MDSDTDQELPPVQPKQKLKKRYVPPQPDKNTFASQQEFLDSLDQSVVPISSLQSNNLKCPHCWKIYGESDPDTDNAERPLKFRCGHVFGDACMKELFRLPPSVKMELEPLEFSSKKSREFAQSIERYVLSRWNKNTPPTSEAVVELFTDLLAHPKGHQPECLVNDWMKPILEKFEPTSMDAILKVYFSKDGVVIDIERTNFFPFHVMQSPHKVLSAAGHPHSFSELLAKTSLGNINTPVPPLDSLAAYYGINSTPPAGVVPQMVPMLPFKVGGPSQSNTPFTDAIKGGPSQPNTPLIDAIKVGLAQSNTPFTDTIKEAKADILKKEPETADVQAAKERIRKKRRQAEKKCRENSRLAVARALAEVYEAFQEYKPQHLISESQSKPLTIALARTRNISRTIRILHAKDLKSTSPGYVVEAPLVVGITYEIDSETEPTNQEPAAVPTHDPIIDPGSLNPFLILYRQLCQCVKCYLTSKARDAAKSAMIASTPVSVTWSHNKDLPNSCPLCSRILFLRGFEDRRVLWGDWTETWTETHGEINLDGHHSA